MLKRVLIVTETGDAWPSGYIRALIYRDSFAADNVEVHYTSRRWPRLTRLLEQPSRVFGRLLHWGAVRRLVEYGDQVLTRLREAQIVRLSLGFDSIYLQKVGSWPLVLAMRRASRARLVYDLNDAVWLPSRSGFAQGRIADILRTVDAVTCDNPYGLEFARRYNPSGFVVPDAPQVEAFDQVRSQVNRFESPIVLGWVGSSGTLFNLYLIWESLEKLFARFDNITLRLLGVGHNHSMLPPFEQVRYTAQRFYSQQEMIRQVLQMDVGLFPLFDCQDSRVRGILKATIYMSGEACLIASPIGQIGELITDGQNGVLARSPDEWLERLTQLVQEPERRRRIASAGLQTVREKFTLRQCYQHLLEALCSESR